MRTLLAKQSIRYISVIFESEIIDDSVRYVVSHLDGSEKKSEEKFRNHSEAELKFVEKVKEVFVI